MSQKVTVKTLDSKNHEFDVSEDLTVKQFKEVISPVVGIPVENQRLIFRGRVLQDDKKLLEYNVANNTVHLVQRPNPPPPGSTHQNDEPPVQRNVADHDRFDGGGHGIIITAGTSPTDQNTIFMGTIGTRPSVDIPVGEQTVHPMNSGGVPRRASSAAVRLQIGNDMINRASALLSRLEEDDEISQAQASSSSAPIQHPDSDETEEESHDSQSSDSNAMEIDPEDPGSFNRMLSQVANAAVLASVRNINPNSNDGMNVLGQLAAGSNNVVEPNTGTGTTANNNNNNNNSQGSNRRPEAPRVRELAIALQDLIAFQERLVPFLQFVQNMLRENRSYNSETGEIQSMQFVYDQVSSILHLLGHGLHAFSDLVCDFSSAPQTRRLISAPGILVEQSTVVRATIPVPVAAFASNLPTNNTNPTQTQQQQQQQFIWNQLLGNNNTNNPPQQQQSSASPSPNAPPTQQQRPSMFSTNPSSGNLPTGISINIQSNGMPDLASLLAGATGGAGGGAINAGMLPFLSFGSLQQQPQPPTRAQQQQQNNSATPGTGINSNPNPTTTTTNNNNNANNNNNNSGIGAGNLQQSLRNELMRPPFDILLSCHSHHASRNRQNQRPSNLHTHVKVETPSSSSHASTTTPSSSSHASTTTPSFDFFQSLIDLIRSSNCLELCQPYFKDIIQNYLMRGRDVKNSLHVKTCARTIAKKQTNFFKSFVDNIAEKDSTIDMQKTLSELVCKFYFKLFSLTLNSGTSEFRNSVILLWEDSLSKLFTIFRVCFPKNNNRVPELFAKAVVDEYFVGASLIFKSYAKTCLQDYFVAFHSQITDGNVQTTTGLIFKVDEIQDSSSSSSSSNPQASLSPSNSSSNSQQTSVSTNAATTSTTSVSSPPEVKKKTFDSMDVETDIDIDNLIAPTPPITNESARTELSRIERIPEAWREVVLEDINRQLSLLNQQPPPRSVGFSTLFPGKH